MRLKVLVVDDEFYTRKAIIKMLTEKFRETLTIEEAGNGAIAIEIISKQMPDVVLTDVRMPKVDGLQLAEYIYEHIKNCIVIIFSGYADFEYAQRAIKYGVIDYILKPVKKEDLFKSIHNAQDKMNKTISVEADEKILKDRLQVADKAMMERKLIESMHHKNDDSFPYSQLFAIDKEPLWYKIFILFQNAPFYQEEQAVINELMKKDLDGLMFSFLNETDKKEWIIFCFGIDKKEQYENHTLKKQVFQIKKIFFSLQNQKIVLGASNIFSVEEPLNTAYEEAKKATMVHFALGWGKIYEYDIIKELWANRKYPYYEELRIFRHLLGEGEEKAAVIAIKNLFLNLSIEKPMSLKLLDETNIKLSQILMDVWEDIILNKNKLPISYSIQQYDLSNFSEITDLINSYCDWLHKICQNVTQKNEINQPALVNEMTKYMLEYYYEDISLEAFAKDKYFMHVSHLSRIFREETGDTFSNTLLKIRMEKARQLLDKKDISITQVAVLSGYNNTAYFVKIFKRFYNETPGDYKKKL